MALTGTQSWDDVARALLDRSAPYADVHRDRYFRTLIDRLRSDRFPYAAYPEADGDALHIYPADTYDFDLLFGRRISFEYRVLESWTRRLPLAEVSHVAPSERFEVYEERSWQVGPETVLERLEDFFDEVEWPTRRP